MLAVAGTVCAGEAVTQEVVLGGVEVTAIKQDERVERLPVASTVVGRAEIERLNVVTVKNISEIAPNFYIPDYGSRVTSSIYVRGMGARIDQPVVGLNVDNVPYLNKDNYDFDLTDIERIEMLRGPQSTLYGRNTMGGLVNIYTISPMKWQGVRALAEYGTHNSLRASLGYYTLLSPKLGMSVSALYGRTDGWHRNSFNDSRCGAEQQGAARWRTVWRPRADLSIDNVAAMSISRQNGYPYRSVESGSINYNDTCFYRRTSVTDGLTVKWTRGSFSLSSITSFQWSDDNMTLDQDFLPEDYFTLTQKRREWAVTQDFVARGQAGVYNWLGGVFGFVKHDDMDAPVTFKSTGIDRLILSYPNAQLPAGMRLTWDGPELLLGSDFDNPVRGIAVYHQSGLDLGNLALTAGLRLDVEQNTLYYHSSCDASYTMNRVTGDKLIPMGSRPVAIDDHGRLRRTFVELLPKFTATYTFDTQHLANVYLSVGRGYKAGGFNTQMFSDVLQQQLMEQMGRPVSYDIDEITSYKPETSWNYEAGTHVSLLDGRLDLQGALFYIRCRDQQLTVFPDGTTTGRMMANAGKTRSYGVELEGHYNINDHWAASVSYGFTDARFVSYNNGIADFKDNYIPYSPKNTLFGGVTYRTSVNWGPVTGFTANVNCRGVGEIMWDEANTLSQPLYATLGASAGIIGSGWSLSLWGENLTDTQYDTFYFVSINNAFLQRGKPVRGGVTFRLNIN